MITTSPAVGTVGGQTDSIVTEVEDCIVVSHERISKDSDALRIRSGHYRSDTELTITLTRVK